MKMRKWKNNLMQAAFFITTSALYQKKLRRNLLDINRYKHLFYRHVIRLRKSEHDRKLRTHSKVLIEQRPPELRRHNQVVSFLHWMSTEDCLKMGTQRMPQFVNQSAIRCCAKRWFSTRVENIMARLEISNVPHFLTLVLYRTHSR